MNQGSQHRHHRLELWAGMLVSGLVALVAALSLLGSELLVIIQQTWILVSQNFWVVNTSTPVLHILLPSLFFALVTLSFVSFNPEPGQVSRAIVITLLVFLYTGYMAFRLFTTFNFATTASAVFSVLFFLAEGVIYLKSLSAYLQMFWPTRRSSQADLLMKEVESGRYLPAVDIFVPTYSEPVEILRRTILGCQCLDYPRKSIYLLDDQRRPEMRALAEEIGCNYRDRFDNRHAKAGNMNAALSCTHGELIAVFDADFIPTSNFLKRTVGFFKDPEVGLIQTPQNFYSVDAVSRNLGLPGVLTEEQQVFFRSAQPGRDTLGAMICHGTSFVIRREALDVIGGFPGETLSEDWATSIKLQSAGYHTWYLNELLSAGVAAEFLTEFVTQRLRWARGTLQCFFSSTNPLNVPGLRWWQRLVHLSGPLHYVQFVCRLFCLSLPLLYFFFGVVPLDVSGELLLVFLLPYWVCQSLSMSWLTGGHRSAFWSEVYETLLCVPMTVTVISTLVKPFGMPFKVSRKGENRYGPTFNSMVGGPLLMLLALYLGALIYAIGNADWYPSGSIFTLAVGWAVYSIVLIWLGLQASVDPPQGTTSLRFRHRVPGVLWCDGVPHQVFTRDISDVDATLVISSGLHPHLGAARLVLDLQIPGWRPQNVATVDGEPEHMCLLQWKSLPTKQHRAVVSFLFTRPGQWDERGVPEHRTFWHFLLAPFRMHSFAQAASYRAKDHL